MPAILVVDSWVQDIDALLAGLASDMRVALLEPGSDGIKQMLLAMRGAREVDAIHIVSQGSSGTLVLGNTVLDASHLDAYRAELAEPGASLAAGGDLLLWGCDVAAVDAGSDAGSGLRYCNLMRCECRLLFAPDEGLRRGVAQSAITQA